MGDRPVRGPGAGPGEDAGLHRREPNLHTAGHRAGDGAGCAGRGLEDRLVRHGTDGGAEAPHREDGADGPAADGHSGGGEAAGARHLPGGHRDGVVPVRREAGMLPGEPAAAEGRHHGGGIPAAQDRHPDHEERAQPPGRDRHSARVRGHGDHRRVLLHEPDHRGLAGACERAGSDKRAHRRRRGQHEPNGGGLAGADGGAGNPGIPAHRRSREHRAGRGGMAGAGGSGGDHRDAEHRRRGAHGPGA